MLLLIKWDILYLMVFQNQGYVVFCKNVRNLGLYYLCV